MTVDWIALKHIALDALDLPAERRSAYVIRVCRGDMDLCRAVLELVDGDVPEGFMQPPVHNPLRRSGPPPPTGTT